MRLWTWQKNVSVSSFSPRQNSEVVVVYQETGQITTTPAHTGGVTQAILRAHYQLLDI